MLSLLFFCVCSRVYTPRANLSQLLSDEDKYVWRQVVIYCACMGECVCVCIWESACQNKHKTKQNKTFASPNLYTIMLSTIPPSYSKTSVNCKTAISHPINSGDIIWRKTKTRGWGNPTQNKWAPPTCGCEISDDCLFSSFLRSVKKKKKQLLNENFSLWRNALFSCRYLVWNEYSKGQLGWGCFFLPDACHYHITRGKKPCKLPQKKNCSLFFSPSIPRPTTPTV